MASDHKYTRLDSVRGLAAFSVGVGHAALLTPFVHGSWLHAGIVAVFNGHYAVDVFFVLSGFVLTNMVREFSGGNYVAYLGRRLLRLYPPLWSGLIVAYAIYVFMGAHFPCAPAIHGCTFISGAPTSIYQALRYAFPTTYHLDPVVWSIRVELEASIVYPFLLLAWRWASGPGRIALLAGAALMTLLSPYGFDTPQPHYMLLILGLPHFLLLFLTGIAISDYRLERHAGPILGVGIALLLVYGLAFSGHTGVDDIMATASGAALISVAAYQCPRWLAALLDNRAIHKLGEISYSYYLVNAVALWVIVCLFAAVRESPGVLFLIYVLLATIVSVPISWAMNKGIEKPCTGWSRVAEKWVLTSLRSHQPYCRTSSSSKLASR